MKGLGAVACLCWLLASVGQTVETLPEAAGQTFTYEVQSDVYTGIPSKADQYSVLSLAHDLKVQVISASKALFKIDNVRSAKLNEELSGSYAEDLDIQHTPDPIYERELSKPFAVHFNGSQVWKIVTSRSDPEWSVNIKKSLADKFQVDLKRKNSPAFHSRPNQVPRIDPTYPFYSVYEEGIGGECETRYSIQSVPSLDHPHQSQNVWNVTKVKNYRNCLSRVIFETDNFQRQGSPIVCEPQYNPPTKRQPAIWRESSSAYESGCHFGFEPDYHPAQSYLIVKYNISSAAVIEDIQAEGRTAYYVAGNELFVISRQNITLVKKRGSRASIPEVQNPVEHKSLQYQLPQDEYLDSDEARFFALYGPVHVPDLVEAVQRQLESVVSDIIPDEPETSQDVGPKVIQLVKALTVLKKPELEEIFKDLESDNDQKMDRKQEMKRKVFLDILAIAATNEIALYAKELLTSQRIKIWEAAELIEGIAKNIDDPSPDVIEEYIKLLDRPRIQKSRRAYPSVAIAVGKMIREACSSPDEPKAPQHQQHQQRQQQKEAHQQQGPRHPRSLRPQSSEEYDQPAKKQHQSRRPQPQDEDECSPEDLQKYIKAIVHKLRDSKTPNKIIVHIEALVHMGTPEVLPYLKPYLTDDAPNLQALDDEDEDFVQTAAIYSLHHLAESSADELLPLVTGIYFDQSEDYETRIAAFSVVMATQPPLTLLQRVMTELHDETNKQVASYVYSLASELANSTMPYERKLAQKLQLALPHAPEIDLGWQYSQADIYTYYDDDDDYGLVVKNIYTASNVSQVPRNFYHSISHVRGPFKDNLIKVGGLIKGADELIEKMFQPGGIATQIVSSLGSNVQVRNVPEVLDVVKTRLLFKDQDVDIPRAFLYYKLFGRTSYLTLDEDYLAEALEHALDFARKIDVTSGFSANYAKIWMPSSFVRVVPSPVGLPVMVSHRRPVIFTLFVGNTRFATNKKKEAPLQSTIAVSTDIQASLQLSSIAMASVFNPAHDEVHGVALEKTTEAALAAVIEVAIDPVKDTYALSIKPKLPHEILSHETRPSTYIAEATIISEPKEEWLEQVNEIQTIPEPFKYEKRHEGRAAGLSMRVSGESESPWADLPLPFTETAEEEGIIAALLEWFVNPEMTNRELHVYLEPHRKSPASEIVLTFDYDKHLKLGLPKSAEESEEESSEEEDYEKALSSIYGRSYAVPDAEDTIQKLVQKTQASWAPVLGQGYEDPVPATVTHVAEVTMAVKGQHTKQHAWRGVYAHSLDFRSNWFQLFGHSSGGQPQQQPWQFCASAAAVYPQQPNPFYLEMNTLKAQQVKLEAEAGWGRDCQQDNQIKIEGVMKKSEDQLTSSSGSYESEQDQQSLPWYFKQCQVDKAEGQTQSEACQQAIADDSQLNRIELTISAGQIQDDLRNATHKIDLWAKYAFYPNMEANPLVSNPEDQVTFVLEYNEQPYEIPLIDVEVHKPSESLVFRKLYIPDYEPPSTLDSYDEVIMDQYFNDDYSPSCDLMEDYISTFDNVTVELPDNKCQYILAHDSSPDKAFTIIASQIDLEAKTKALSMALAGHSIKALPPRGEAVPIVLNGKQTEVTPKAPIVRDFDKDTELRIYVLSTSSPTDTPILVVEAPDDDITVQYDGKNARIELPRKFQGDQAGLCGDFNDETFQEFTGPHGCVYVEEEDFANSYAIPGQSCTQPPKPRGPAFCPGDVIHEQKWNKQHYGKQSEESAEVYPEAQWQKPSRPHSSQHPQPPQQHRYQPEDSQEEPSPPQRPAPVGIRRHRQESSESMEEDQTPDGKPDCIQAYTPTIEDKANQSTCFATQPVYKCRPGCRPVRPKATSIGFHCIPQSKYEKDIKEKAKSEPITQMQNKKPEKYENILIPEKCL